MTQTDAIGRGDEVRMTVLTAPPNTAPLGVGVVIEVHPGNYHTPEPMLTVRFGERVVISYTWRFERVT